MNSNVFKSILTIHLQANKLEVSNTINTPMTIYQDYDLLPSVSKLTMGWKFLSATVNFTDLP